MLSRFINVVEILFNEFNRLQIKSAYFLPLLLIKACAPKRYVTLAQYMNSFRRDNCS